jgi:hypothetical protein
LSVIEFDDRQKDPEIDCCHGGVRLASSVTGVPFRQDRRTGNERSRTERRTPMVVTLNRRAYEHAKELISEGGFVFDERDAWSEHRPSAEEENEFIRLHGSAEYGKWYFGINDEKPEQTKGHYEFPYGDFKRVHRCGLLAAESRAGQYQHHDIENATAHLHGMLEGRSAASAPKRSPSPG